MPTGKTRPEEVRKVVDFLEPLLEERGVRLRQQGDAQVDVETSLIRRAVSNLLQNAIEHSDAGSEIVVRIEHRDGTPCVAVSNPGRRIEGTHVSHLFERFYRADPSRANSGENHGLGLSIVKAVATMHRGAVFARSEAGWNTFGFTVTSTKSSPRDDENVICESPCSARSPPRMNTSAQNAGVVSPASPFKGNPS